MGSRDPGPRQRRRPPGLPDLPAPLSSLRSTTTLQDPSGSDDLVCGQLHPHSSLPLLPWQHPPAPGTVREA